MGKDRHLDWLEAAQARAPGLAPLFSQLAELYQRKLWHQLTVRLEEALGLPELAQGDLLIQLYENFVEGFAGKVNLLRLAHIAVTVAGQHKSPAEAVAFLEGVIKTIQETKQPRLDEPLLFLRMKIAQYQLEQGGLEEAKAAVEAGKERLAQLHDVDPSVSALTYYVASLYYKAQKDFAEFYKASLLYLAYISSDALPHDQRLALAVDISLAGLLGENIYNFGELLLHPIIKVLDGSPYAWLHDMLRAFNAGDLAAYDGLCARHAAALNGQPALVAHERKLREKVTILCLMELIFELPAEARTVALTDIAARTKLSVDGVEFLLMKTLSLHLIEGVIDQVDGVVHVSWVQPRVLTLPQVTGLAGRLDTWIAKVNTAAATLEEESIGVVEAEA